jgi:hypothetical protein
MADLGGARHEIGAKGTKRVNQTSGSINEALHEKMVAHVYGGQPCSKVRPGDILVAAATGHVQQARSRSKLAWLS